MPERDTKSALLDAAESLFAANGFAATSMRQLAHRAGVNLAAAGYHFGGKSELAMAVLARRIGPINAERRRRLAALPTRPAADDVVRAFLEPVFGLGGDTPGTPPPTSVCRLFGRLLAEQPPFLRTFLARQFRDLGARFAGALRRARPELSAADVWWRLHFTAGALAHALQHGPTLVELSGGACRDDEPRALCARLVQFASAGFAGAGSRRRMTRGER